MFKVLFKIVVIIFVAEVIIMFALDEIVEDISPLYLALVDGSLLALLSLGPIYYWVIKPYMDETSRAKGVLGKNASKLSAIVEAVVEGIVTIDAGGTIKNANSAADRLFGYSPGELIGQNVKILMTDEHSKHHDAYLENHAGAEKARILGDARKLIGKRKDDTVFPIQISIEEMVVSGGRMYTGVMRDLTQELEFTEKLEQQLVELEFQRQAIEEAAQGHIQIMEELEITKEEVFEKNQYLHEIMDNTGQGVLVFNSQLLLAAWNNTFLELCGMQECELREHMTFHEFLELDEQKIFVNEMSSEDYISKVRGRIVNRATQEVYTRDLKLADEKTLKITQRIMDDGSVVTMYQDVTIQREEENHIKTMALRDSLTGLANRRAFDAQLDNAFNLYLVEKVPFLLAFIDLDNFKAVNDTHGHGAGDAVLQFVASRLRSSIRCSDVAVRLGGDEFAIIFRETNDLNLAAQRLDTIIREIKELDELDGYPIDIGASAGLVCCSSDETDQGSLMEMADKALYRAKEMGKGQVYSL